MGGAGLITLLIAMVLGGSLGYLHYREYRGPSDAGRDHPHGEPFNLRRPRDLLTAVVIAVVTIVASLGFLGLVLGRYG